MNRKMLKDVLKLKMEITNTVLGHLPPATRERLDVLQRDVLTAVSEAAAEYLEKQKPAEESKRVKAVPIE